MNLPSIIVLLLVLLLFVLSARVLLRPKGRASCGCSGCSSDCTGCDKRKIS